MDNELETSYDIVILPLFTAPIITVGILTGGKDKTSGIAVLACVCPPFFNLRRKRQKTIAGGNGFRTHGKEYLRRKGLGNLPAFNFKKARNDV